MSNSIWVVREKPPMTNDSRIKMEFRSRKLGVAMKLFKIKFHEQPNGGMVATIHDPFTKGRKLRVVGQDSSQNDTVTQEINATVRTLAHDWVAKEMKRVFG